MKKRILLLAAFLSVVLNSSAAAVPPTYYSVVVSNDNPSLYWNFDEASGNATEIMPVTIGTTNRDLIPVANATRVSHASLGDGLNLGNAASFQIGDYFICENLLLPTNSLGAPWLIEFWIQVQGSLAVQRNNYVISFGGGGGNRPAVLYDYVGGAQPLGLELFGSGGRTGAGPLITDLNWHHVLFAFYGDGANGVSDRLDAYVDGTNAAENIRGTFSLPISLTRLVVGTSAPQFAVFDGFEGNVDEIAVYDLSSFTNSALVTARVSQMASNHFSLAHSAQSYPQGVLADSPILYWNFDETNGSASQLAPVPELPVQNDLTPTGGAGRLAHAAINSKLGLGMAANIPKGGYFSGQLTFPGNSIPSPWLMEFWMQATGSEVAQRNSYLVNFGNSAPAILYDYIGGAQPRDGLELFGGGGRSGAGPVVTGTDWHHVLFAYYGDGTSGIADRLDVYLDGTNAAQNIRATFGISSLPLAGQFVVGTSGPQFAVFDGFEGNLDEVAIYNLSSLGTEGEVTTRAADLAARHFAAAKAGLIDISKTGSQVTLSWNSSGVGFVLESTLSLAAPQWTNVNITPVTNNGVASVLVPIAGQSAFFRLRPK